MDLKVVMSIMMLLALSWPSTGTDCLYLGNGTRHQIINLDAGAKLLDQNVPFTRSGFAAPSMPQPMALSSNVMITQAKKFMDEACEARNESVCARDDAKASADKAAQAEVIFNKTEEAYRKTLALSVEVEGNMSRMKSLLEQAKGYAQSSAESAKRASESHNSTSLLHNETAVIFSQSSAVYNNMILLEKEVQTNSDNIRTMMNEMIP